MLCGWTSGVDTDAGMCVWRGSPEAFRESAWDQAGHHPVSLPHFHPLGAWRASYNQRPRALSLGLLQGVVVVGRVEGRGSVEEGREQAQR